MVRNLSTLSILHYVYGAFICIGGLVALLFIFVGGFLNSDWITANSQGEPPPAWLGGAIQIFGAVLFVIIETWGILTILAGKWISQRKHRTGTMVMAGFHCLNMPLGIALGIFTFVVMSDEEVKREYAAQLAPTTY